MFHCATMKIALQAIDLRQPWPARVGVEHFTGRDRASFDPSVSLVHSLCSEKSV